MEERRQALTRSPLFRALVAQVAGWAAAASPILPEVRASPAVFLLVLSPFMMGLSFYFLAEHIFPSWSAAARIVFSMGVYFLIGAIASAVFIAARMDFDLPPELILFFALFAWPLMVVALFLSFFHIYI
jgi:hypothetical protein